MTDSLDTKEQSFSTSGSIDHNLGCMPGDEGEPDELQERFALVVFLLGQFNAHYHSKIKNQDHLQLYWQRFTPFYEQLRKLPEFDSDSSFLNDSAKWVICEGIKEAMLYRRKLVVGLSNLVGVRFYVSGKKFQVLLVENRPTDETRNQDEEQDDDEPKLATDHQSRKVLGDLELKEGATACFTLPVRTRILCDH